MKLEDIKVQAQTIIELSPSYYTLKNRKDPKLAPLKNYLLTVSNKIASIVKEEKQNVSK